MKSKVAFSRNPISDFHYKNLKDQVYERVKTLPPERKNKLHVLAFTLPVIYVVLYILALSQIPSLLNYYLLYCLMGVVIVFNFLSVIHETVHRNLFQNSRWARAMMFFMDMSGANSYIWKKRHLIMHHNYPNISGWDTDIQQAGIIKIYPHGTPNRLQRFQHYYFMILYPLYLINWIFIRDFKDFFSKKQLIQKVVSIPSIEYNRLFAYKTIYFTYILVIPILLGLPVLHAFLALCCMLIVSGIFAMTSLLTPHANIKSQFPLPDDQQSIQSGWFFHQFSTTNDISLSNWVSRNLMGNFNFHLAHHLFPNISCVYAPEVTEVIREYATKNNLPYRIYPFFTALRYHFLLLKRNALNENIFEEDM